MTSRSERIFGPEMRAMMAAEAEISKRYAKEDWRKEGADAFPEFLDRLDNTPPPEGMTEDEFVEQLIAQMPGFLGMCKGFYEEMMVKEMKAVQAAERETRDDHHGT